MEQVLKGTEAVDGYSRTVHVKSGLIQERFYHNGRVVVWRDIFADGVSSISRFTENKEKGGKQAIYEEYDEHGVLREGVRPL